MNPFLDISLGHPKKEWMKDWFIHWLRFYFMGLCDLEREEKFHKKICKDKCECSVPNKLARAAVNFAILYLETNGIVPISKSEIRKGIKNIVSQDIFKGLNMALKIHHENRFMNCYEALEVGNTATWFKDKLIRKLSVGKKEMEETIKMYNLC